MNAHTPIPQYDWRTIPCPNEGCDDGWVSDASGWQTEHCDECEGRAVVDASCAECSVVKPINADGLCELCADKNDLSIADFEAKYLGNGRWQVAA